VYTHLGAPQELVQRAFDESGEEMWLEGQPDPRAPKPQTLPEEKPTAPPPPTSEELPAASAEVPPPRAAGCSVSSEPQKGAVEYAAGLVALVASIVGLRRRFGRKDEDGIKDEDGMESDAHRARMPSLP